MKKSIFLILFSALVSIVEAQLTVDFSVNQNESCGSLQAVFQDNSTSSEGAIISWNWDLAGIQSTREKPGRIFSEPGRYTICLEVTDINGNINKLCKDDFVIIHEKPIADFKVDYRKGCTPLTVTFDDLTATQANIKNWIWDIGGNKNVISTADENEIINTTYVTGGFYSVSLSVEDTNGCKDAITKKDYIEVFSTPKVVLSREVKSFCDFPWIVQFKNENIDLSAKYFWDFGNGKTFEGATPPQTYYYDPGVYDIKVVVEKGECKDTFLFEKYINTDFAFEIDYDIKSPCSNEQVTFYDLTKLSLDSIKWNFGNGTFSNEISPSIIFGTDGCFIVEVTRYFSNCQITTKYPCITVKPLPEVKYELDNQFTCNVPVDLKVKGLEIGKYKWQIKNSSGITQPFDSIQNIFTLNEFGQYFLDVSYENTQGCANSETSIPIEIDKFTAELPRRGPSGCVPLKVFLTDSVISNVGIASYSWTIPQLNFWSKNKSPQVTLIDTGRYDVQLIVKNVFGCKDTILRNDYLQGGIAPTVDFTAFPLEDCLSSERTFLNGSSSNADFWIWSFGDDTFSSDKNPTHTYNMIGTFDISLSAFHNGCGNDIGKNNYINILEPISQYEILYNCEDPYTIDFNNLSIGADSMYWFVENSNGAQDTIRDTLITNFTFPNTGKHILGVYTKSDSTGCVHIRMDTVQIVDLQANYTVDTLQGCKPLSITLDHLSSDYINYNFTVSDINVEIDSFLVLYQDTGKYSLPLLQVEDIHGCIKIYQDSSFVYVNGLNVNAEFNEIICVPDSAVMKNISTSYLGNIDEVKWKYNDSIYNADIVEFNILDIGTYQANLIVSNDWGCVDSVNLVFEGINATSDFSSDTLGCIGTEILFIPNNQALTISDYLWDFGDGSTSTDLVARHSYATEGVYTVCLSITDIRGCTNMLCKENYIEIANPVAQFQGSPLEEECPPLISDFTNSSQNAIRYQWKFGDDSGVSQVENPSHIYTEPGIFDVSLVAIRSELCKDTLILEDYVLVKGPKGNFSYDVIGNCTPLEVKFKASSDRYYKYLWDFGNGEIDSSETLLVVDSFVITYYKSGNFTPKLIITDDNGCARTFSSDAIQVNEIQSDFELLNETLCDVPITLNIKNKTKYSTPAINFEWEIANTSGSQKFYQEEISTQVSELGKYDVTLISSTKNCLDTIVKEDFINITESPIVDFDIPDTLCASLPINIKNNSYINNGDIQEYNWTLNGRLVSEDRDLNIKLTEGQYNLTLSAISKDGCISEKSTVLSILPNPEFLLTTDEIICIGEEGTLKATLSDPVNSKYFSWSDGNSILCTDCLEINVNPPVSQHYYFSLNNKNGCFQSDSIELKVAPVYPPAITLSEDTTICLGTYAEIFILDYNNDYNYSWEGNGVLCKDNCISKKVNPSLDTYYEVLAQNTYGCETIDTIQVLVETTIPDFLIDEKFICEDASSRLTFTGGQNPIWVSEGDTLCTSCVEIDIMPTNDQMYFLTVNSLLGCTYTDSLMVQIVPLNSIDAGDYIEICKGESIILGGKGIGDPTWSPGVDFESEIFNPSVSPDSTTQFLLKVSKDECTLLDSVLIDVIYKAEITAMGDTVCLGESGMISATGKAQKYTWYENGKAVFGEANTRIQPDKTKQLMVVGSRTTCENDTAYVEFFVHPKVDYELVEDRIKMHYNSRVLVTAIFSENENYSYTWLPEDGLNCSDCPTPLISDLEYDITYSILIKDEQSDCEIEEVLSVRLDETCSKEGFFIPNAFSPNDDGRNDEFLINIGDEKEFLEINILDKWGNILFNSSDPNFRWDGRVNGYKVNSGVYVYLISAFCPDNGEKYKFGGDITIFNY